MHANESRGKLTRIASEGKIYPLPKNAEKMENILKSPHDGVVKKIAVKKGVAVEKNQVLINF